MDARIRLFIRIVEEHSYDLETALRTASNLLGLSEARLRLMFKRETGKPLSEHSRKAKMDDAAELLKQYNLHIKEVAQRCGYGDICNFYRDFKRVHGITPKQSRARHMNLLCQSSPTRHLNDRSTPLLAQVSELANSTGIGHNSGGTADANHAHI